MSNRGGIPNTDTPHLKSVHQCIECGATCERDDITEEDMITGVIICKACGHSGPLKVVIVKT